MQNEEAHKKLMLVGTILKVISVMILIVVKKDGGSGFTIRTVFQVRGQPMI